MVFKTFGIVIICVFFLIPTNIYSSSIKEDYELQERCGKRCEEYFKNKYGLGVFESKLGINKVSSYKNHYNKKLNKCFIYLDLLEHNENTLTVRISMYLRDINENKDYGSFIEVLDFSDVDKDVKPYLKCVLLDKSCNSEKEWDLLVKPFMEE